MTYKEALSRVTECGLNIEEPLRSEAMELIKAALEKHSLIKAEAIKEFAERLKKSRNSHNAIWDSDIDNLVKEMVGE